MHPILKYKWHIAAAVAFLAIICYFNYERFVDMRRTVDYPVYQNKVLALESNPDNRTPNAVVSNLHVTPPNHLIAIGSEVAIPDGAWVDCDDFKLISGEC